MHLNRQTTPTRHKVAGVSLVELMVGLAVGLIIVGATGAIYISTTRGGKDALNSAKLNTEIRGAVEIMAEEIRRAGGSVVQGVDNPYTNPAIGGISVHDSGGCLVFSYQKDWITHAASKTQISDKAKDIVAFRVFDGAISMGIGNSSGTTASCNGINWQPLTDSKTTTVAAIDSSTPIFKLSSQCMNSVTGDSDAFTCSTASNIYNDAVAGKAVDLLETATIEINLQGELKSLASAIEADKMRVSINQQVVTPRNQRVLAVGTP
jgi:prepilin peptidase dependent protein B